MTTPPLPPLTMNLRNHQPANTASDRAETPPQPSTNDIAANDSNSLRNEGGQKRSPLEAIDTHDAKRGHQESPAAVAAHRAMVLHSQRENHAQAAIEAVKPSSASERQALIDCVEACFQPNSTRLNQSLFPRHTWQKPTRLSENTSKFCNLLADKIAQVANEQAQHAGTEAGSEDVIREAVTETFSALGDQFSLEQPLSLFVFDTETNRLFGDVVSIGWIRLDVNSKTDVNVECKNCILPPNFVAYGAERVHRMSPEWIKSQHAAGNTVSPEETARRWLGHAMASKSVVGFNLLYDLNAVKRLLHTAGVERLKVDALMAEISDKFSIDAQDFLLRIDPITRYEHHLPFSDTKPSRKFADENFDNSFEDGAPINYLPNRKLVSYASGFLKMDTDEAHDALYDCVMTLATYAKSVGLRNEVLAHERDFTRKSDKRLSTYSRTLSPSEALSRRINAPAASKAEDRPIYMHADSSSLFQNPALKSTPFIYKPTGPTIHRRHIIPKSTLANLLIPNKGFAQAAGLQEAHALYKALLAHPNFRASAEERLSDIALKICDGFKNASLESGQYDDPELIEAASEFIKAIEQAQAKDVSIRYFERDPAKQLIADLPASGDIQGSMMIDPSTMHKVMAAVLYSFYHSLEFNQFIGPGAENVMAGRIFHALDQVEPTMLQAIENAPNAQSIENTLQGWLSHLQTVLSPGASDSTPNDVETQVLSLQDNNQSDAKTVSADTVLYFLEMRQAIHGFLETFINFTVPDSQQPVQAHSAQAANALKQEAQQKLNLFLAIVHHHETQTRGTFPDTQWCRPLSNAKTALDGATSRAEIEQAMSTLNVALSQTMGRLENAALYDGDKKLLHSAIMNIFADRAPHRNLLEMTTPEAPAGDTDQHTLSQSKKSAINLVRAIRDNTAYDLPSNAARALQNSHLIPLYQQAVRPEPLSLNERVDFFNGLLDADNDIADRLGVTRAVDQESPIYGNYMPYLY